ncbi:cytochrome b/b6 domain-containing protein [Sulfitobacter sp. JB4-11]|uniref:cytochrome b/b6 domain-containing protein n=1 Tax=Sulfitobacter rhodophyticola TaxID=3238304 RepID=UPI003515A5E0
MALSNTAERYGGVTKTFHWLTALLILTLIPLGWYANQLPYETEPELARKAWLFSLHKTLGVAAFFTATLRILWALSQTKPALLNADKPLESRLAELVHWMLYGALVIVPLSGWIGHAAAAGFAPIWWPFGQNLPLVPKSVEVEHFASAVHWVATKVLIAALVLHIAGALKHHVVDRDATLLRMLPGTPGLGPLPEHRHPRSPVFGAVGLWVAALALAAALNTGEKDNLAAAAVALEEVASEWQVEEGSIEITVIQFGNPVTGTFADWTAAITFDETVTDGPFGDVTTTVSIPSLTLGSVTDQAMGADFFDAANHPTATFSGQIKTGQDGYLADGTLRIKDNEVPVALPFSLAITGDRAEMNGSITLNRLDFGVGNNMQDEGSLAFAVDVVIKLTATRGAAEPQS